MEKLPIYKVVVNDDDDLTGVDFISLVDEPAMELNWIKLNKQKKMTFVANKDKKMLYGVFIVPDKLIYRWSPKLGEYYTMFEKSTIEKIVKKFNKNQYGRNINFQHGDNRVNAFVVENFIVSDKVKVDFGFEVPEGSWAGSVYIDDDQFWKDYIKSDTLQGFSIELISELDKVDMSKQDFETYNDYPKAATENAKVALRWAEENGWGDCGTAVGKARANQLANGENISRETISRMAAFERHRQNSNKELGDGCGRLMWLAWGGDEGIEWAQRKLEQIDREDEKFEKMIEIISEGDLEKLKELLK